MNHLTPHWMDTDNHMKGDPDDFKLPRDDDDGGEGRQRETDVTNEALREVRRIAKLDYPMECPWCKEITFWPNRIVKQLDGKNFVVYECSECHCETSFQNERS